MHVKYFMTTVVLTFNPAVNVNYVISRSWKKFLIDGDSGRQTWIIESFFFGFISFLLGPVGPQLSGPS